MGARNESTPRGADGQELRLGWAERRTTETVWGRILFVSRLPPGTTSGSMQGALEKLYGKYGPLIEVHVAKARERARGFAFVEYNSAEDANRARLATHDKELRELGLPVRRPASIWKSCSACIRVSNIPCVPKFRR